MFFPTNLVLVRKKLNPTQQKQAIQERYITKNTQNSKPKQTYKNESYT